MIVDTKQPGHVEIMTTKLPKQTGDTGRTQVYINIKIWPNSDIKHGSRSDVSKQLEKLVAITYVIHINYNQGGWLMLLLLQ